MTVPRVNRCTMAYTCMAWLRTAPRMKTADSLQQKRHRLEQCARRRMLAGVVIVPPSPSTLGSTQNICCLKMLMLRACHFSGALQRGSSWSQYWWEGSGTGAQADQMWKGVWQGGVFSPSAPQRWLGRHNTAYCSLILLYSLVIGTLFKIRDFQGAAAAKGSMDGPVP